MTAWARDELDRIGRAEELELASVRRDGTRRRAVTIWVVRVGDELYIRSVNGRSSAWFRGVQARHEAHLEAGGVEKNVVLVETEEPNDAIDQAYRAKYPQYAAGIVGSIVSPTARAATLRIAPSEPGPDEATGIALPPTG